MLCGTDPFPEHYRAKKYRIHDHYLTREDFFHMMRNLPEKVHDDDIKEMFDFADANQDGKISYEEFQIMINPPKPVEMPRPNISEYRSKAQEKKMQHPQVKIVTKVEEKKNEKPKTKEKKTFKESKKSFQKEIKKLHQSEEPQLLSTENIKIHNTITKNIPFKTNK